VNDLTRDQKIEALVEAARPAEGDFIEFDGQNCGEWAEDDTEACRGWDGRSPRCDCGNRRVYWETSDDDTYVYAVAD